jgi:hypothetical protein
METEARTQTAFRLKDGLLERLKWQAKREKKSLNAFVEEVLEEKVGRELVFPKLPPEFFEKAREETERFVLKGAKLPKEYEGLDASEYPEMDKRLLADALYEKYITRT